MAPIMYKFYLKKYSSRNKKFENLNDIVGAPENSLNGNLSMKDYYLKLSGLKELKAFLIVRIVVKCMCTSGKNLWRGINHAFLL